MMILYDFAALDGAAPSLGSDPVIMVDLYSLRSDVAYTAGVIDRQPISRSALYVKYGSTFAPVVA